MIPVLSVPVLSRYDLLRAMLDSVDVPVGQTIIVDNGGACPNIPGHVLRLPANIGVGAAWNLAMKATTRAPWWLHVNTDITFAPGDLARVCEVMADPEPKVVSMVPDGFSAFALNRTCLEMVGWFDENFHPAYCEDADYEYRCRLEGVPILHLPTGTRHARSVTIADPRFAEQNARTYPANVAYYEAKWGGSLRGGERYATPFDRGGSVADWTLDLRRLREQAWG